MSIELELAVEGRRCKRLGCNNSGLGIGISTSLLACLPWPTIFGIVGSGIPTS